MKPPASTKANVIADYLSGYSQAETATRNGVSASTAHNWITAAGVSRSNGAGKRMSAVRKRDEELGLTGGRWVNDRGIQRWQSNTTTNKEIFNAA